MPNVERCSSKLAAQVVRVRRKRARAIRVALGASKHIGSGYAHEPVEPVREIEDQLILFEDAARFILKDVVRDSEWSDSTAANSRINSAGQRRIDVP